MATLALPRNEITESYFDKLANHDHITVAAPEACEQTTKILFINPMPETNGANAAVERNKLFALGQNPDGITVEPIILRPKIIKTENAAEMIWPEDLTRSVMDQLENGEITGVISFGAGLDDRHFDTIKGIDTFDKLLHASVKYTGGLHAICWSSMYALNLFHDVPLSIEPKRIGHFNNIVSPSAKGAFADALRKADVLPTGSIGCMDNKHIRAKADAGELEIIASSDNMGAHSDFSITWVRDLKRNVTYEATHSEYGKHALPSEQGRDKKNRCAAKHPVNLNHGKHSWLEAFNEMTAIQLKESKANYNRMYDNDNTISQLPEGQLTLEAQA